MGQTEKKGMGMVFVLAASAVLCAVATFIAVTLLVNRVRSGQGGEPEIPAEQVNVDGMVITLRTNPAKAVNMADDLLPTAAPENVDSNQPVPNTTLVPTQIPPTLPPAPTATPLPPPTPVPEQVIYVNYVVNQGDSLYSIADQQNSSIELMARNSISSSDIYAGNNLNLPVANPAYCPGNRAYVVRDHDTLYGVARTYNTTPEAIAALNGFNVSDTIYTTQVICIPTT